MQTDDPNLLPDLDLTSEQPFPPGEYPENLYGKYNELLGTWATGYIERNVSQSKPRLHACLARRLVQTACVLAAEAALVATPRETPPPPGPKGLPLDTPGRRPSGHRKLLRIPLATKLDYSNAIGPATLSPYLQFQHDVNGYSPSPGGPFEEGRTALTLGVGVNYLERWRGDLSYTNYNGDTNYLSDRDFVSLSMSYSF